MAEFLNNLSSPRILTKYNMHDKLLTVWKWVSVIYCLCAKSITM